MDSEVIYLDWNKSTVLKNDADSLYQNRKRLVDVQICDREEEVTVFVLAFNNFEKTKNCVKYLLEYTKDVPHNLVLMDYGNEDAGKTLELFKSVEHPNKTVISINKNQGLSLATRYVANTFNTKYYAFIANDVYVTKNWLTNSLKCIKSDDRIGFVSSMSSNTSNYQNPGLKFETLDEMQQVAEEFNVSNPNKWFQKRRLITIFSLTTRELLNLVNFDDGFAHNFGDDDFSVAVSRAGYKLMLCGDVFLHHDHASTAYSGDNFERIIAIGRVNFKNKYFGLDAWNDFINYESTSVNSADYSIHYHSLPSILGIDVKTGIPLYEIKNRLRKNECSYESNLYAFTKDAKYYFDLQIVCDGKVKCDRIDFIADSYQNIQFDYIILGDCINTYEKPFKLLETIINLLAPNGQALIKIKNTLNIKTVLHILGIENFSYEDVYSILKLEDLVSFMENQDSVEIKTLYTYAKIDPKFRETIDNILLSVSKDSLQLSNAYIDEYFICITKK